MRISRRCPVCSKIHHLWRTMLCHHKSAHVFWRMTSPRRAQLALLTLPPTLLNGAAIVPIWTTCARGYEALPLTATGISSIIQGICASRWSVRSASWRSVSNGRATRVSAAHIFGSPQRTKCSSGSALRSLSAVHQCLVGSHRAAPRSCDRLHPHSFNSRTARTRHSRLTDSGLSRSCKQPSVAAVRVP